MNELYVPSFDVDAVVRGEVRLSDQQALELLRHADLTDLGDWGNSVCLRRHPEDYRTYIVDRNINYTNVCTSKCTFCGFRRDHDDHDSYTLTHAQIGKKIEELLAIGGTQILMQGGMNDRLPIDFYTDLLQFIPSRVPDDPHPRLQPAGVHRVRAVLGHGRPRDHEAVHRRGPDDPAGRRGRDLPGARA